MDVSEIKFCNKTAFNIKNNREKSNIIKYIYDTYHLSINKSYFKFYNDSYLQNITKNEYFVNTLTQGTEYWLFLTRINNEKYSLFIDKKLQKNHTFPKMIITTLRFKDHLYNDTLFNGELVRSYKGNWTFLIDDLIVYNGRLYKQPSIEKIRKLHTILKTECILDNIIHICPLKIKHFFTLEDLNYIITDFIPSCNYNIIGLTFIPFLYNEQPIRFYFKLDKNTSKHNIQCFKASNSLETSIKQENYLLKNENTEILYSHLDLSYDSNTNKRLFTFQMNSTKLPNVYTLYILDNNKLIKHSIAKIDTLECGEYMRRIFQKKKQYLIDCYYYKMFNKWTPVDISKHKNPSNYMDIKTFLKSI